MTSLDGAVTLIEMNDVSFLVSQDLHFDVLGVLEVLLNEYIVYTKSLGSFGSGGSELRKQFLFRTYDPHTSSAAACGSLEDDGITAHSCKFSGLFFGLDSLLNAGYCRNSYGLSDQLGLDLIAQVVHHDGSGSDEFDPCLLTCCCEFNVLRKESVAGMDGVCAFVLCKGNDLVNA